MPFRPTLLLAAAALVAACSPAPQAGAQTPVHWTISPARVDRGGSGSVTLTARIDDGWHIYAVTQGPGGPVPTRITLAPGQPLALSNAPVVSPAPTTEMDESFGIPVQMHERHVAFTVKLNGDARAKLDSVRMRARYQACSASLCLPPQTAQLSAPVVRLTR